MTSTLKDIMTKDVISVSADTPLMDAYKLIIKNDINGMPVVDDDNNLDGIITEYDLIVKGSSVHLPTLQKLLGEMDVYKDDNTSLQEEISELQKLKVKDLMNPEPLTLKADTSLEKVVQTFKEHHRVNPIPVLDEEDKVVGVVSRYDVVKLYDVADTSNE